MEFSGDGIIMMFYAITIIASLFQSYLVYLALTLFFDQKKPGGVRVIVGYLQFMVLTTAVNLYINIPIANIVVFMFCTYLYAVLCFYGNLKRRMFACVSTVFIMAVSEGVMAVLIGALRYNIWASNDYHSTFSVVAMPIIQFQLILLLRNLKNIRRNEEVQRQYWILSMLLPALSFALFAIIYQQHQLSPVHLLICICILFFIQISVLYLFDKQIQNAGVEREKSVLETQNRMQQEQAKWLEQAVEQMRGQRHDFKKHISMIYYFNEKGKTEEVEKYIRQIQDNIDRIREEHIDTGNYALDSILNAQMSKAQLCGVNLQVECVVPQELNLSTYDMNVMLTNLLDNSIEAAQKTEEKKVQCVIRYDMPRMLIKIENTYIPAVIEHGTSKKNKEYHGYGVKNVRELLDRLGGDIEVNEQENIYQVLVGFQVQ